MHGRRQPLAAEGQLVYGYIFAIAFVSLAAMMIGQNLMRRTVRPTYSRCLNLRLAVHMAIVC